MIDYNSSCQREINYRATEDKLREETARRRKCNAYVPHLACKCGSYHYVLPNIEQGIGECEQCWLKRRYVELIRGGE